MPDFDANAVAEWLRERAPDVVALPPSGAISADPFLAQQMNRLGHSLDVAMAADPALLSAKLRHDPVMENLRLVLTQAGPPRRMRALAWFMEAGLPQRQALLEGLTASGVEGDYIRSELQALHRRALLAAIFAPVRIEALLNICRPESMTGGEA